MTANTLVTPITCRLLLIKCGKKYRKYIYGYHLDRWFSDHLNSIYNLKTLVAICSTDLAAIFKIVFLCTLVTVSFEEIIGVCGYKSYGTRISNIAFVYFPAFRFAIFKDDGRQYKCHNISKFTSH